MLLQIQKVYAHEGESIAQNPLASSPLPSSLVLDDIEFAPTSLFKPTGLFSPPMMRETGEPTNASARSILLSQPVVDAIHVPSVVPNTREALPPAWEVILTEDGSDHYYHNVDTGATQWERP